MRCISETVLASDSVTLALAGITSQLKDRSTITLAGVMAADDIRAHINKGSGFAPLSPATITYRGEGQPLREKGVHLRDSITSEVIDEKTAVVGTTNISARIHNNGGEIKAKKNWLCIPARSRSSYPLQKYRGGPKEVLNGLRSDGYSVYRAGHTLCYRKKGSSRAQAHIIYYLKKSVIIPKREFWYLTDDELQNIMNEIAPKV